MSPATRGDGMRHPVAIAAVAVLLVNDHLLKGNGPPWLTGKLSDVAGLLFFPLLLQAAVEVVGYPRSPRAFARSDRLLLGAIAATAAVFAAINTVPAAADGYRHGLGALSWPLRGLLAGAPPGPVSLVEDATDLLVLPVLWLTWRIGRDATRVTASRRTHAYGGDARATGTDGPGRSGRHPGGGGN